MPLPLPPHAPRSSTTPLPVITTATEAKEAGVRLAEQFALVAAERDGEGTAPFGEVAALRETGLLPALVPTRLGGGGLDWNSVFHALRPIIRADTGLGHVFVYHFVNSWRLALNEDSDAVEGLQRGLANNHWFWGGAGNPRDANLALTPVAGGFTVSGRKFFATGAQVSDRITASGTRVDTGEKLSIVIDATQPEVTHHDDWDSIGQRLSASGSVSFTNAFVPTAHVLGFGGQEGPRYRPYASLSILLFQLALDHVHVGLAEGALAAASDYVTSKARPWSTSGVDRATDDPHIRALSGVLQAQTRAADALTWRATEAFALAAERGWQLTDAQRGEAAVEIAAAKVFSTDVALTVSSRIFELTGARATSSSYAFDRFWRNARTITLHDPVAYKAQEVGDHGLVGTFPTPSGYS
ncbi:acyl-CoA dehydrogenase family protein [Subtercola frigoramans]|uniref:Alkylation response protein AidB-like acyl-CoA dehydrogenase n=1 Tax=Subtercola frigoramans TaxID=120298 RepID=A0ABS2L2R1_9MICO|nr:acyl-CoA dehydrogenase family protein [Subtercola frigoramans]MBM7471375.1 alkylation response protein AidB-like acyl-CoA dehydrogenase [Subtercola frigoramans]